MKRRSFLGRAAAALGGLLGLGAARAGQADGLRGRVRFGKNWKRAFRLAADGWREIESEAIRPGDEIVFLGCNDGRLWCAEKVRVRNAGLINPDPGEHGGLAYVVDEWLGVLV